MFNKVFFRKSTVYEITRKNFAEPDMSQIAIRRMRIACWIPTIINTHSVYETLIVVPLQQLLHKRKHCLSCPSCRASTRCEVRAFPYRATLSRSLNTSQSVGLLWTSEKPKADSSTRQHTTITTDNTQQTTRNNHNRQHTTITTDNTQQSQQTDIHALVEIRTHNPSKQRPHTHALDSAATGIGNLGSY